MNKLAVKRIATGVLVVLMILTAVLAFAVPWEQEASALTLKRGSTGTTVKTLQSKLKDWGYYTGSVDGIYGSQTVAAVKYFQRKNKLQEDGIAGPKTLAAMGISSGSSGSSNTSSSSDTYLLARVIYGEARGEPYVGQVAIGAVVLNRVRSSSFPNTLSGVIYQPWAFTAVNDGQINLTPDETAIKAAKDALSGWDPTYGCLFYYNPKTATNAWIRQKKIALTIGRHVFCY